MQAETGTEGALDLQENIHLDDTCAQWLLLVPHLRVIQNLSLKQPKVVADYLTSQKC